MGAKSIPMPKKRGRTVLGVRIGLAAKRQHSQHGRPLFGRSCSCDWNALTAMLSVAVAETRYLWRNPISSLQS